MAVLSATISLASAPIHPALSGQDEVIGYIKIAPLEVVFAKVGSYSKLIAPMSSETDALRAGVGHLLGDPEWERIDPNAGAVIFIIQDDDRLAVSGFFVAREGASPRDREDWILIDNQILIGRAPDDLAPAVHHIQAFQKIFAAAPAADMQARFKMEPMLPFLERWMEEMGGEEFLEMPATPDHEEEIETIRVDVHMARMGAEIQMEILPKAGTELEAICHQPPVRDFPVARFLPDGGGIRAVWNIIPTDPDEPFHPDGAFTTGFPDDLLAWASIRPVRKEQEARRAAMDHLAEAARELGVPFEALYQANARMVGEVPVDNIHLEGATRRSFDKLPQHEMTFHAGHLLSAGGVARMDAMLGLVKSGGVDAPPLRAQKVFPDNAQAYVDIDVARLLRGFLNALGPLAGMFPVPDAPSDDDDPPVIATAMAMTDGVVHVRIFVPSSLWRLLGSFGSGSSELLQGPRSAPPLPVF